MKTLVQNFLLFQPMAGSIFAIEYWVSSKSWWHNFQRLFWEATSGLYGCFCPSWTISGYRGPFGLCKTFFGDTLFTASKYVYEQTAIAYEVCCLLWCRLVAVEIDGHQQWTNDWHTSLRMCLLHTGDTTIFNHLDSQSFVFPKWRISCDDRDGTRRPKSCRWLLVLSWDCRKCIILFLVQTVDLDFKAALNLSICLENLICLVMFSLHINPMYLHDISVSWYAHINKNNDNSRWFVYSPLSLQIYI